jgi:hypothetical protein
MRWCLLALITVSFPAKCQLSEPLEITTGEVRVEYCDADADLAMATMHVRVVFTNRGKRNLILSRAFSPGEPDEDVSVTDMSGVVLYAPHPTYYGEAPVELGSVPDDKMFEVVEPGASVGRDLVIGLPISKDPAHRIGPIPAQGDYRISARRTTWPFYSDGYRARQMRDLWKRYGSLVIMQVRVHDIHVQISLPQQTKICK